MVRSGHRNSRRRAGSNGPATCRKIPLRAKLPLDAMTAWSTLGYRWLEMMNASHQVISHRTRRSNTPAQWYGMGSEKVVASVASSHAMARRMATFPSTDPLAMWTAWARLLGAGMAPYRARAVRNARGYAVKRRRPAASSGRKPTRR